MSRVLMAAICSQSSAACLLARLPDCPIACFTQASSAKPAWRGFFCMRIACNRRWSLHMVVAMRNGHAIGAKSGFRALVHHGLMCGRKAVALVERKSALQGLKNRGFHGCRLCGGETAFYTTCRVFLCFDAISSVVYFGAQQVPRGARLGMPCGRKLHVAGGAGHHANDLCLMA